MDNGAPSYYDPRYVDKLHRYTDPLVGMEDKLVTYDLVYKNSYKKRIHIDPCKFCSIEILTRYPPLFVLFNCD